MSTQKGNWNRSRAQKHQNTRAFKNNMHDKSKTTKTINSIQITNVCDRCRQILEWKIKYKKYKLLKTLSTCCKCLNKCIKEPYHTVCHACSSKLKICPKCGKTKELISSNATISEKDLMDEEDNESSTSSD